MWQLMRNRYQNKIVHPLPDSMDKKNQNAWWLVVFPVLLLITGILYLYTTGDFFLKSVDPEYAYLFNGAVLADHKPDIYYVDHPGTPLIVLIATVIRTIHMITPGQDVITEVIKNPELYIKTTIFIINLLSTILLFLLGLFAFKKTRNILLALFLQLIPFVQALALETFARLTPESLMLILICLWIILAISMISVKKSRLNWIWYGLASGILTGLCVAVKLTLIPFVVIPLIILSGWKDRLLFAFTSVISFFVFAFPILYKYEEFYYWVKNIVTHTGIYGTGDRGVVHWDEFFGHLKLLLANSPYLLISLMILIVSLVLYLFVRKEGIRREPLKIKLAIAAILVVLSNYGITAKHFAFHYMLPSILLTVPIIILAGSMLGQIFPFLFHRFKMGMVILGILILVNIIPRSYRQLSIREERRKILKESYLIYLEHRSHGPLIISPSYYGCSAVEYALTFGIHVSGKYGPYIYEKMNRIYPSTWLYFPWGKVFYAGRNEISPSVFLQDGTSYMLYIAEYSKEKLDEITGLLNQNEKGMHWIAVKVYQIESSNEALFQLQPATE